MILFMSKMSRLLLRKLHYVEESSRLQSASGVWRAERDLRLTSSNFGKIFLRRVQRKAAPLVKCRSFKGNINTRFGLAQEANAILE